MNVRFGAQIAAAAAAHHLDPRLLAAVAAQETGGPGSNSGRNIVGDHGHGHGVFQIDDRSWAFARSPAAMNPAKNAEMAATILADNLHTYGGDIRAALAAYNTGSPQKTGTLTTWGDGATLGYAASVMRHYDALAGESANSVPAAAGPAEGPDVQDASAAAAVPAPGPLVPPAPAGWSASAAQAQPPLRLPFPPASAAAAPMTPVRTWTQLTSAGANESKAADQTMAALIDSGNVFGDDAGPNADENT